MDKQYIASEYRRLHAASKFSGGCLKLYISEVRELIKKYDCKTILDYGCGKALYHDKAKLGKVTLYDPYYDPYSKKPEGKFDIVICTDVMEHIPMEDIENTINELIGYTNKVLFLSICTKPANKRFANGKNVHLTIRPEFWWEIFFKDTPIKIVRHYT